MKRTLMVITLLALLVPSALWAQEELTLELLAGRLDDLVTRVEALEKLWAGPGAIELANGDCLIGSQDQIQDETVLGYKEKFDKWLSTDFVSLHQIVYSPESGHTFVTYADSPFASKLVVEEWSGCEYIGSSDWYED